VRTIPKTKFCKEGSAILFLVFARGQKQSQKLFFVMKGLQKLTMCVLEIAEITVFLVLLEEKLIIQGLKLTFCSF
jgi:hypothetical protein